MLDPTVTPARPEADSSPGSVGSTGVRPRSAGRRALWLVAGGLAALAGVAGLLLPLLPGAPFLLIAAACFSRGCERCERWLLEHPRFGPPLREWREHRVLPSSVKWFATLAMALASTGAWWVFPPSVRWLPALCCLAIAWWLWRLPAGRADT